MFKKIKNIFKISKWLIGIVYKKRPFIIIGLFFCQILLGVLPFARDLFLSNIIDVLIGGNYWLKPFLLFIFVVILIYVLNIFNKYLFSGLSISMEKDLKIMYSNKVSSLDYQCFEDKEISNLIFKTKYEYAWRSRIVIEDVSEILFNIISLISIIVVIIPRYWYLAIILIVGQIPKNLAESNRIKADWQFFNKNIEKRNIGDRIKDNLTSKKFLSEIKINNSKNFLFSKMTNVWNYFAQGQIRINKNAAKKEVFAFLFSYMTIVFSFLILIRDVSFGLITIGMLTFYFSSIQRFNHAFEDFVYRFINISEQNLYISDFKKIMGLKNIIKSGKKELKIKTPPKIEFKNVWFKYPSREEYVFKNLNLVINPEEEVAIVGVNGAGKTTLVKLLLRFYDPNKGKILINGVDLKKLNLNNWYGFLSFLSQEFNTYTNLSLKENVFISRPNNVKEEDVLMALENADAFFIKDFKKGINTLMDPKYGGTELSWGQWQKVAIARVFYKQAQIMILDEPTASIDAVSETKIFDNIYEKLNNKTAIIISHRFSTVRNASKIIVLDKGLVVEQGTHEELMKNNDLYAKSFNLQAKGYLDQ